MVRSLAPRTTDGNYFLYSNNNVYIMQLMYTALQLENQLQYTRPTICWNIEQYR